MNKRTFLKTLLAGPVAAWAEKQTLTNWAGNVTYGTSRLKEARSVEEVRRFVRSREKVKVLGSRHCFNWIADSADEFLSLKPMHEATIDTEARTVTVEAGATYGQLCPYLESQGWALHNLASLPHISVAGAVSTATHGSGEKNGNLATAVAGLEMVTAAGEVVKLTHKDGEAFRGAVVGLGALGAITRVTLHVQPTYRVRQFVYQDLPLDQMREHFDEIQASGYSVSLFTDWRNKRLNEVWIKSRVGAAGEFAGPAEFFGAKAATRNLHPIAEIAAENCTEQMGEPGPWYERLPHFKMGFTPSAGKELQTEYFVPRGQAVDAILAVERLRERVAPLLLISEIRTVAADDLWMSTAHGRASVTIHFTWKPDWAGVKQVLPEIERELGPFQYRPHWGKLFTTPPGELRAKYERLGEFVELAKKHDPKGKFRNEFLERNVFGA